jgi:TPR repeat protein
MNGQFSYGFWLFEGRRVPIHDVEAAEYFKLSADQNDFNVQSYYGKCPFEGRGAPTDDF